MLQKQVSQKNRRCFSIVSIICKSHIPSNANIQPSWSRFKENAFVSFMCFSLGKMYLSKNPSISYKFHRFQSSKVTMMTRPIYLSKSPTCTNATGSIKGLQTRRAMASRGNTWSQLEGIGPIGTRRELLPYEHWKTSGK